MALFENKYRLTINELKEVSELYQAHCTAEYAMENYDISEEDAIKLGYAVREEMSNTISSEGMETDCVLDYTEEHHIPVKLKEYKVTGSFTVEVEWTVEARSEDEAREMGEHMQINTSCDSVYVSEDDVEFISIDDIDIDDVKEVY